MAKSLQGLNLKREFEVALIYGFSGARASYIPVTSI